MVALCSVAIMGSAGAAVTNNGFEKGNLSSFSIGGDSEVRVRSSFLGYTAAEGQYFAHMSNTGIEDLSQFGGTIGSYMSKTITLAAGQGFSFKWAFVTTEGNAPYNDFALFLNGSNVTLSNVDTVGSNGRTGWNTYNWTNTDAFSGTVTWVVGNDQDELSSSHLLVDDIQMRVSAVPEADSYAMMVAGLALAGWMARRRKVAAAAA